MVRSARPSVFANSVARDTGIYTFGISQVTQDALPWVLTVGNRAETHGLNLVGLRHGGATRETIRALKRCYRELVRSKTGVEEASTLVG